MPCLYDIFPMKKTKMSERVSLSDCKVLPFTSPKLPRTSQERKQKKPSTFTEARKLPNPSQTSIKCCCLKGATGRSRGSMLETDVTTSGYEPDPGFHEFRCLHPEKTMILHERGTQESDLAPGQVRMALSGRSYNVLILGSRRRWGWQVTFMSKLLMSWPPSPG